MLASTELELIPKQVSNNTSSDRIITPKISEFAEQKLFTEKRNEISSRQVDDRKSPSEIHSNINASEAQSASDETVSQKKASTSIKSPKGKGKQLPESFELPSFKVGDHLCTNETRALSAPQGGRHPPSYVFVTAKSGTNFRLQFKAVDVSYEPLFIFPRKCKMKSTDKDMQVISRWTTCEEYNWMSSQPYMKRPKYVVAPELDTQVKAILPPLRVYSTSQLNSQSDPISRSKQSSTTGFIHLKIGEVMMKILVKAMPITKMQLPVSDEVKSTMGKLNMPTSDIVRNRARLIVRYKNDVLRVSFNLKDCSLSRLPERKSLAIQAEDKLVLRYEYSPLAQKMVYLEIPQSTYVYRDPMVDIRRLNNHFAKLKISPLWKHEVYHKRISETRGANTIEIMVDKTLKQSRGSCIIFEGFNSIATANGGLFCANIFSGQMEYEEKIYSLLGYSDDENVEKNENSSAYAKYEKWRRNMEAINDVDLIHSEI